MNLYVVEEERAQGHGYIGFDRFFEGLKENIGGIVFTAWSGNPFAIVASSLNLAKFITGTFFGRDIPE